MTSTKPKTEKSAGAPAVARAAQLLRVLADAAGREVPLTELAAELDAAKSSTLSVCASLEEAELIVRRESGYKLGRGVLDLAGSYLEGFDQVREFYGLCATDPVLRSLVVQIAMLDGTDVLYLARHEGRAPLRVAAGIGSRFPASSTAVGQALLAEYTDAQVKEIYAKAPNFPRMTPYSVQDLPELLVALGRTRQRGYSVDQEGVHPGLVGVAVPLAPWNAADVPLTIGASFPAVEASTDRIEQVGEALKEMARQLTNPMRFTTVA